jgi:hypothetical protein
VETPAILIAQTLADEWVIIAQRYAGYFTGYVTHAGQHGMADAGKVYIEFDKPWVEPLIFEDGCDFCKITSDDRVRERVLGFQAAIDIEVTRAKDNHYVRWVNSGDPKVPVKGSHHNPANRRAFVELFQEVERPNRPSGWRGKAIDMTKLPSYLQRRLCIEWNHALRAWLEGQEALEYDFEAHALVIRGAKDSPQPLVAADQSDLDALRADLEADHTFAASLPVVDNLTLPQQIAQEYEDGL